MMINTFPLNLLESVTNGNISTFEKVLRFLEN